MVHHLLVVAIREHEDRLKRLTILLSKLLDLSVFADQMIYKLNFINLWIL